jgi:hypothetical protein
VAWSAGNPKLKAAPADPPVMENCAALKVPLEVIKPTLPVRLRKPIAPGETVIVPPPPATKLPKLKPRVELKLCAKRLCSLNPQTKSRTIKHFLRDVKTRSEMAWVN